MTANDKRAQNRSFFRGFFTSQLKAVMAALKEMKAPDNGQYRKPMTPANPLWWKTNAKQRRMMRAAMRTERRLSR